MHAQDLFASADVGIANHDLPIETSGPQQRRVEDVVPVRRGNDDDAVGLAEAIHFHKQLVQGLLALFVTERIAAAVAADGIELVDENDAGLVAARILEQAAHA